MRVAFVYPPYSKDGKFPHLSQNRQFRYTASSFVRIYPLIPASLLTLAKKAGHDCLLLDAISRRMAREDYEKELLAFRPEVVILETKTPVMKLCWEEVEALKSLLPNAQVILVGDHSSAEPVESLESSPCDFVVTGGDYDVAVAAVLEYLSDGSSLPNGVYARDVDAKAGPLLSCDLDELPFVDRELTRWADYGEAYLFQPAMYVLSGRGCGRRGGAHAGCTFCSWQHNLWRGTARLRSPQNMFEEVETLSEHYHVSEFFDDNESGPFWNEPWVEEFCDRLRSSGISERTAFSANARADSLTESVCGNLRKAGFRLLKVGLESANDVTLERLNKGETAGEIAAGIKRAKDHGLRILITTMVGYPWESDEDAHRTFRLAKELFEYKCRIGDSLQCSVLVPYPGTPLHSEALGHGWLNGGARLWEDYDMDGSVLETDVDVNSWCSRMWWLHLSPICVAKSVISVRRFRELATGLRGLGSLIGHLSDYAALPDKR